MPRIWRQARLRPLLPGSQLHLLRGHLEHRPHRAIPPRPKVALFETGSVLSPTTSVHNEVDSVHKDRGTGQPTHPGQAYRAACREEDRRQESPAAGLPDGAGGQSPQYFTK